MKLWHFKLLKSQLKLCFNKLLADIREFWGLKSALNSKTWIKFLLWFSNMTHFPLHILCKVPLRLQNTLDRGKKIHTFFSSSIPLLLSRKDNAKRHIQLVHFENQEVECQICQKIIKNNVAMSYHMKKYHSGSNLMYSNSLYWDFEFHHYIWLEDIEINSFKIYLFFKDGNI